MAKYYVSGIWTNSNVITDLNVHLVTENVQTAKKHTLQKVIQMVEAGDNVFTTNWNYPSRRWTQGAKIHVVNERGGKYLRSNHDKSEKDNLDNMLPMRNLGC